MTQLAYEGLSHIKIMAIINQLTKRLLMPPCRLLETLKLSAIYLPIEGVTYNLQVAQKYLKMHNKMFKKA